ncbi:NADPH-dependent F420 reductase [Paenibacillus sp. XY044]|uniref:NADPH-dependent F420 reductase n=1 Tax=Paenibacillus sp. XY044 TaxID=2026089 RepID=UPI000B97E09F|nr:NAD(P)-binding domain-containing protein [Paenibacillus sp. XY044]OZB95187.1 NADP oxidoreductase [Paenibacillus sp. XY044]
MKIGVIGTGHMGGTLGKKWAAQGHEVMFGTRDPHSGRIQALLQEAGAQAQAGTVREAAAFSEVILLAVMPDEVERVLEEAGTVTGKILINCTNRFDGQSADTEVRKLVQGARVVRAFHTLPWEVLAKPRYEEGNATVFLSGEDTEAKDTVARLSRDIGLDSVDVGGSGNMERIETGIGMLWQALSPQFGRDFGIRVLRRESIDA